MCVRETQDAFQDTCKVSVATLLISCFDGSRRQVPLSYFVSVSFKYENLRRFERNSEIGRDHAQVGLCCRVVSHAAQMRAKEANLYHSIHF